MNNFFDKVRILRRDDHRYYHQSRINQTLHLISAISFLIGYVVLFFDPAMAGIIGWAVGMVTRQSGHIFFEPRGFDAIHKVSYEYKESIKAGYNMQRKGIIIGIWLAFPVVLYFSPSLFGLIEPGVGFDGYLHDVGMSWLALGVSGIIFRTVHLSFLRSPAWGLAWAFKILSDPFHNVDIYAKSPLALLRGEKLDPLDTLAPELNHAPM